MNRVEAVANLAQVPDHWSPVAWVHRLRQLADRCESLKPERAADLREAADTIEQVEHGA